MNPSVERITEHAMDVPPPPSEEALSDVLGELRSSDEGSPVVASVNDPPFARHGGGRRRSIPDKRSHAVNVTKLRTKLQPNGETSAYLSGTD